MHCIGGSSSIVSITISSYKYCMTGACYRELLVRRLDPLVDAAELLGAEDSAAIIACLRFVPADSTGAGNVNEDTSDMDGGGIMVTEVSGGGANEAVGRAVVGDIIASFICALERATMRLLAVRCADKDAAD